MKKKDISTWILPAVAFLLACGTESGEGPLTPAGVVEDLSGLAAEVGKSLDGPKYFSDDTWHLHYGDGLMFGPSYDLATWTLTGDEKNRTRALAALETNLDTVEAAGQDLVGALDNLESVAMALLGLLESGQFLDEDRFIDGAEALMTQVDTFAAAFGDYLVMDAGEFAAVTYGPTSISSLLALMHLEHALARPATRDQHLARAEEVLEHIHEKAWDDTMGAYLFAPDDERLMLYPNATMMLAYGRALELTADPKYLQRIAAIHTGIQPLRDEDGDHYHSPYSAEEMGAQDDDYSTLSSQNYLMIGLWLAYLGSADLRFLEDIHLIMGFIRDHLLVNGVLVHHWMNDRPADATDLYDFCSGCNLQTLYILRIMEIFSAVQD